MAHGTQRTHRVYTGSGLLRVKPYVQFLIVLLWMDAAYDLSSGGRPCSPYISWHTRQGQWTRVEVGYNREPIASRLQHNPIFFGLSGSTDDIFMSCLARQVIQTDQIRSFGRIFWKVFGATDRVYWARCQVGDSSDVPDLLVGDGREPGRWGPRGTLVSP
jgi:hypothetical protein